MASFIQWQAIQRAQVKVARLLPVLHTEWQYLDIGCGNGSLTHELQKHGYSLHAADIRNKSLFSNVQPRIYDGKQLPYQDNAFDAALLITVLHHVHDVAALLREAQRISRYEVIVMEDIYTNTWQRWLTEKADSLVNAEWGGHPHNNHTHRQWLRLFDASGLTCHSHTFHPFLGVFLQVTYRLRT